MSNNISRKGLAWGALVAIAASLFATAPAHAAVGVTLAANSTSQVLSVPTGTSFQLVETASSEIPSSSYPTLAVAVEPQDAGNALVTVGSRVTGTVRSTDSRVVFSAASINAQANNVTVEIRGTDSATHSFKVTTWLDANANGVVDAGEYSAAQIITFKGAADLTATTSFVKVPTYTGDARSVQVRTELTNVNTDQLKLASAGGTGNSVVAANVSIDLRAGTYDARLNPITGAGAQGAAVFVSGDARFYATQSTRDMIDISADPQIWKAGAVFTAQAYWGTTKIGAAASSATGLINNAATGISVDVVKGANALLAVSGSASVRTNSAFQVSATVRGDSTTVLAGQSIKFTVSQANWQTGTVRVTVNGTTYSTSADLRAASWTVAADANGNALLNVAVAGSNQDFNNTNNDLTFVATSGTAGTVSVNTQQTDATASATNSGATPAGQSVVLGKAANVVATIKDQFGSLYAKPFVASVSYSSNGSTAGSAASNTFGNTSTGSVTVPVTVDGTVTGTTHYQVVLSPQLANGTLDTALKTVDITIVSRVAADLNAGYVVNVTTATARISVDAKALAGTAGGSTVAESVSGRAVITADRYVSYAAVTVAGAGLFVQGADGNFVAAPAVIYADVNGYFTASIRSNTSGTATGTVAAGSATPVAFAFGVDAPAITTGASVVASQVSQQALAGATVVVTFSARDTFGNVIGGTGAGIQSYDGATATLSVHVSGDITRDDLTIDAKGYITSSVTLAKTGAAYLTATYSTATRLYTSQVVVTFVKATVTVTLPDTITAGQNADVVVSVADPAGNAISGVSVSATSNGVGYLTVASGTTDSNGQATLKLFANENELGWAYITASGAVNSVTATSDATGVQVVAPDVIPTATDSVANVALEVPATAQAGTVVDVVATATDADGNPVSGAVVAATSTGVGYLAINGGTTDENGQVVLKLVISGGENGAASVVATSGSAQSDAAQVTAGVTDANITLNKKRVTVDWSFAANKKVVIVRDGVAIKSFTASSNAADSFSFNLKTGSHKVSVKVGGVTLDSQSYKVAK